MKFSKNSKLLFSIFITACFYMFFSNSNIVSAATTPKVTYTISGNVTVGSTITITVNLSEVTNFYGGSIDFKYDPSVLKIESITKGTIWGSNTVIMPTTNSSSGQANLAMSLTGNNNGISGKGSLAIIEAKVLKPGEIPIKTTTSNSPLTLDGKTMRVKLSNNNGQPITYNSTDNHISTYSVVLDPGKYEDTHPAINFVGNWLTDKNSLHSGGTAKYSSISGNYIEFSFNGTGFKWAQLGNEHRGIAKITVDGVEHTVDTFSQSPLYKQIIFSKTGLEPGTHTVKIEVQNSKNDKSKNIAQCLDYLEIVNAPVVTETLTAGKYEDSYPGINFVGNWNTDTNTSHSSGTVKYSSTADDYVEFKFNGTGFKWAQFANEHRGIAEITIDGIDYTLDTYSPSSNFKQVVYSKTDLSPGVHTVRIRVKDSKNSAAKNIAQCLDYIEIIGTPIVTQTLIEGKYEDTHPGINFVGNWRVDENTSHSGGSVKFSTEANDYFEFKFNGTGFRWAQFANEYRGIAKVTIDGINYDIDAFSTSSTFKQIVYSKTDLSPGIHTVRIEVQDSKNPSAKNFAQCLDYIEVIGSPTVTETLTEGKYEDSHSGINFIGNWRTDKNYSHSGGSAKYSSSANDYIEFKFNGTGFKWAQYANEYRGIAKVTIDGINYNVDAFSPSTVFKQVVYSKTDLKPGIHTVRIQVQNSKNIESENIAQCLDYIEIINTPPVIETLTAGKYEDSYPGISFTGHWRVDENSSHSGGSVKYSSNADDYIEFKFNGTGFKWAQFANEHRGIAKVTIDGVNYNVDAFSPSTVYNQVVYSKLDLDPGVHTVRIEVQNSKNTSAKNIAQCLDYIEIINNPTITQTLTAGKYEDTHAGINFVGNWRVEENSSHSGGSVKYSSSANDYFEFKFNGTGFKWAQLGNIHRGIAKVTIDGVAYNVDTFSPSTTFKQVVYSKTDLNPGIHTVRIEVQNSKNSISQSITQCLDYIEIMDTPVLTTGKYEDTHSAIKFVGNWHLDENSSHSGGTSRYSSNVNDYIEFEFNGTGFKWAQYANDFRGIAKVSIDGVDYNIDAFSPSTIFKHEVYSKTDLSPGLHTVRIYVQNSKNILSKNIAQCLDYIEIY